MKDLSTIPIKIPESITKEAANIVNRFTEWPDNEWYLLGSGREYAGHFWRDDLGRFKSEIKPMSDVTEIEFAGFGEPVVSIDAVKSMLLDCGADLLASILSSGEDVKGAAIFSEVLLWAAEYKQSAEMNNGYVSLELNKKAPDMVLAAVNILHGT